MKKHVVVALTAAALFALPSLAQAQNFPSKELTVVVPWEPGGRTDAGARLWTPVLGKMMGANSIVDNRAGGGGMVGARDVLRDESGHTVGLFSATHVMAQWTRVPPLDLSLYTPVALLYSQSFSLAVHKDSGIITLADFLEAAKKKPMKFGSGSIGGSNHIAAAAFADEAGIKVQHVPYRGDAGVVAALMRKEIDAAMMPISGLKQQVEAGEFVALAVSMAEVDQFHKGMKTFREQGVDFVFSDFSGGIFIPAKVSKDVVAMWRTGLAKTMKDSEVQKRLANLSIAADYVGGEEFQQLLKKWNPILESLVKELGLRIAK